MSHTPGPWSVTSGSWDENGDAQYRLDGIKELTADDARLISAAPDLLESLKEVFDLEDVEERFTAWNPLDYAGEPLQRMFAWKRARAAIAKAEGGAL